MIKKIEINKKFKNIIFVLLTLALFGLAGGASAANYSGTRTSDVFDSQLTSPFFGTVAWLPLTQPANTTLTIKIKSCTAANCSDKTSWTGCETNIVNNTDLSGKGCVVDGQRYFQYQAIFSAPDTQLEQPSLDSLVIGFQYPNIFQKLVSSPFNTTNVNSSVQKITWNASNDANSAVGFQIRTSADNATWGAWCGPDPDGVGVLTGCALSPGESNSFYTDKTGATAINSAQTGTSGNQWIQYATFLKSPDSGVTTPTLSDVTMQYSYNTPPVISTPTVTQLSSTADIGKVKVDYQINEKRDDTAMEQTAAYVNLFYQLNGVTLSATTGALGNSDTNTLAGVVTLNNAGSLPIPTAGDALIGTELVSYTASGNNLTITARYKNFSTNYPTLGAVHAQNDPVYFLATSVTGHANMAITGLTENPNDNAKTILWDAKSEPNVTLTGNVLSNVSLKVAANDGTAFNQVGANLKTLDSLDLQAPTISRVYASVDSTTNSPIGATTYYKNGSTVYLKAEFGPGSDTLVKTGTIIFNLSGGLTCPDANVSIVGNVLKCAYSVGSGVNAADLDVTSIRVVTGALTDGFGNVIASAGTDVALPTANEGNRLSEMTGLNLLQNPGFESDFTNWTDAIGTTTGTSVDTSIVHRDAKSFKLSATGATFGRAQMIMVTPGAQYITRGYLKTNLTTGRIQCDVTGTGIDSTGIISGIGSGNNDNQWHYYSETVTIPAGTTSIYLRCFANGPPNGIAYVDDLSFGLAANVDVVVDTTAPSVTNVAPSSGSPLNIANKNINYTLVDQQDLASGTITFTPASGTTVSCSLNTASLTAISSGTLHTIDATSLASACTNAPAAFVNGTTYTMKIALTDKAGNTNALDPIAVTGNTGVVFDQTAPTAPGKPAIASNPNNTGNQTINWTASTDTGGNLKEYHVQIKTGAGSFADIATVTAPTVTYADNGRMEGTYAYRVIAYDTAGNTTNSVDSDVLVVDTHAPTVPGTPTISANPNNTGNQTITWTASTDTGGSNLKEYKVQRKVTADADTTFADIGTVAAPTVTYADNAALAQGSYTYRIVAWDNAANSATGANSVAVIVDKTLPTVSLLQVNNLVKNGSFEATDFFADWFGWVNPATAVAIGASDATPSVIGNTSLKMDITTGGSESDIQLMQQTFSIMNGTDYTISFYAKATAARTIVTKLVKKSSQSTNYGLSQNIPLTTEWQRFTYKFTANVTATDAALFFYVGGSDEDMWLDGVQLERASTASAFHANTNTLANSVYANATDAGGSNLYQTQIGTTASTCASAAWGIWANYDANAALPVTLAIGDGTKTVCAQFKDNAGNVSAASSTTINLDQTVPTATSTVINSGDAYTANTVVNMANDATDAGSGLGTMSFSEDDSNWSTPETYATSKIWTLPTGDGAKTIFARFFDKAGNVSPTYSDTINLDTAPPTTTAITDDGQLTKDATQLHASWTSSDASGIADNQYAIGTSATDPGTGYLVNWTSTATTTNVTKTGLALVDDTTYYFYVKSKDGAGNWSTVGVSDGIRVDTTLPALSFADPVAAGPTQSDSINISVVESNQGESKYGFSVDNICDATDTYDQPYVPGEAFQITTEDFDDKYLCARHVDQAGNIGYAVSARVLNIDITPPTLSHFYSTSPNSTVDSPTGAGMINITAVYSEPVSGNLQVKVGPMAANVLANLSSGSLGTEIAGTFTIGEPKTGYDSTPDYIKVDEIVSSAIADQAGNTLTQTNATVASGENLESNGSTIVIDTTPPILQSFTVEKLGVTQSSGTYNNDILNNTFTLVANYNKTIKAGGSITVRLNSGHTDRDVTLTNIAPGNKLIGTYAVTDENIADLKVVAVINQAVQDGKGTPLTIAANVLNGDYATAAGDSVINLANFQLDTTAPTLGATPVDVTVTKTSTQTVTINLSASDNFDLSDGFVQFSLNAGATWCPEVAYATSVNFDITSNACGGNTNPGIKTVTAKFIDAAGNDSATAADTVEFDSQKPILSSFSTSTATGIYGPGQTIIIIATYNEPLSAGTMSVNLNNGVTRPLTLDSIGGTTLSGTYLIGDTGSGQDKNNLAVDGIASESVSDTSVPVNTRTDSAVPSTNLTGITIDTTAPEQGTITFDRSKDNNQITISATDAHDAGMLKEVVVTNAATDACAFTNTWESYADHLTTTITENSSSARKACVKFKDLVGNESIIASAITPETPENIKYTDITNLAINPPFKGVFILWPKPTNTGSGDFASYNLKTCSTAKDNDDCTPTTELDTITNVDTNYYLHKDLSEANKYCYKLSFKDSANNYSKYSERTCIVPNQSTVATNTDVAIQDVSIGAITNSTAQVSFKTVDAHNANAALATTVKVGVYSAASLDPTTQVGSDFTEDTLYAVNHLVKFTGLTSSSTYYLKIIATDTSVPQNPTRTETLSYDVSIHPELAFSTTGALKTITLVNDKVTTDSKAVIEFKTDQDAKCFINYWTIAGTVINDKGTTGPEGEYKKNHTVTIIDLLFPDTSYNYTITCSDAGGATAFLDHDFKTSNKTLSQGDVNATVVTGDTTAPEISGVAISEMKGESANITWNTNEKANGLVAYEIEGATYTKNAGDNLVNSNKDNYATNHLVTLTDLIPAAKYSYYIISLDASGNISQSSQSAFTTSEPSSLSSVKVISKALNQATFSWQTGSATTSIVDYGLTTAYGETKKSQASTKVHELTIADLKAGSTYHFRVKGADAQGNLFASNDSTFEPKSPPKIADFKVDEITEHGAKLTFITNVPTDTLVAFTDAAKEENSGVQGKSEFATKHEIVLKNLTSGVTFGLNLKVRDEDGNETEETFPSFQTSKDENAPKIDQIKTSSALSQTDKVQSIISWLTDEGATSTLAYREGRDGKDTTVNASDKLATNHISVITSFKPGTVYYFRVKAKDEAGNESTSTEYAILTPRRKENIIQIILANFQDIFKWAQK